MSVQECYLNAACTIFKITWVVWLYVLSNAAYLLSNAVIMLLIDFPLVKLKCYTHAKIMEWIDQYLSDEAHNEKLILGDADVEEYRSNRDKLLGKGQKEKEKTPEKPQKKRKKTNQPKGILFCLQYTYNWV